MTPKEKAKQLIDKFYIVESPNFNGNNINMEQIGYNSAKECALIMVNEMLTNSTFLLSGGELYYWQEVKEEIEKL